MSTGGERTVGQRPHYRCQQPGVFERHVFVVDVDHRVANDDRAAVCGAEQFGEVGVLSAAGFGGGGLGCDAGFVDRSRPGGEQAVALSRWPDRQIGTYVCGSGVGPSTSTLAPVPRNCCTRAVKPSIHARSYDVKPDIQPLPLPEPYPRHRPTTISRGCSARNLAMI